MAANIDPCSNCRLHLDDGFTAINGKPDVPMDIIPDISNSAPVKWVAVTEIWYK